jgi:LysM repeat protein
VVTAVLIAAGLGLAVGGFSQLTAVSVVDPRSSGPVELTPAPTPSATASPSPSPSASAAIDSPSPEAEGDVWLYTISVGDSISGLAVRFGTTTEGLLALNPEYADNQDLVVAGAQIIMPCTPIAAAEDRC